MADFISELVSTSRIEECNTLLENAENIIGENIIIQVNKYTAELDELIEMMHRKTSQPDYEISDKELEKLIIRIPILVYQLNNILMKVGIKEDLSKIIRQTNYNRVHVMQEGTIADKKAAAELLVKEETLLETTWKRSVKIISQKIDTGNELLSACKKILSKRIDEFNIIKRAPNY